MPLRGGDPVCTSYPPDLAYAYDATDDRTLKTATDDAGNQAFTAYIYDALELRRTTWDGEDYADNVTTEVPYLYAHGVRLARVDYATVDPTLNASGTTHVVLELADHLGSTTTAIDQGTSELVEQGTYQGYGAVDSDYRPAGWGSFREDYRFTGKEEDVEVGLDYFGKRFYQPMLGRWVSADPLAVHSPGSADLNVYAYVHGRVLVATDPMGLEDPDAGAPAAGPAPKDAGAPAGAPVPADMPPPTAGPPSVSFPTGRPASADLISGLTTGHGTYGPGVIGVQAGLATRVVGDHIGALSAVPGPIGMSAELAQSVVHAQDGEYAEAAYHAIGFAMQASAMSETVATSSVRLVRALTLDAVPAAPVIAEGAEAVGAVTLDASAIRFSQSNVRRTLPSLVESMTANGWQGAPIDVVRMVDGGLTAVDNTRLAAASLSGTPVRAIIRAFDEAFPAARAGGNLQGATWGEAVMSRLAGQKPSWLRLNPNGSVVTGVHPAMEGFSQ